MKYIYMLLALVLIGGGYFFVSSMQKEEAVPAVVAPEGSHVMPDGTIMRNDVGTEGMGALDELRQASMEEEDTSESIGLSIDTNAKVFNVKGVNYGFDVKEIRVKKGDTVTIEFESTDGFHDWTVDAFGAATDKVQPGTPASVTFVADEAGTFEYYCSVGQHRAHGMVGKLVVE
jgi:plastocyanin